MHADRTLLPRGQLFKRPNIQLFAEIELASTFIKILLDALAFFFVFLPVLVLTFLVTIPNALAGPALHEGITLRFARRAQLGRGGPIFRGGFGIVILFSHSFLAERQRTELLSSRRGCTVLLR